MWLSLPDRTRVDILGAPLDIASRDAILEEVQAFLDLDDARCRHLVTLNPEYVMLARGNDTFRSQLWAADMVVADGVGVTIAARLLHGAAPDRVTGVDLTEALVARSGVLNVSVFLLGAGDGVAPRATTRLLHRYPGARIAGYLGGASADDDEIALAAIEQSEARVVLVAFGAAGQIAWIERNREALGRFGVRLAIGVGGVFDFLAGDVPRAPRLMRSAGLEWLYRLLRQPWRWRRQRVLSAFAWHVARQRFLRR